MKLEQAIHERWAAAGALSALLPAEKLSTGFSRASGTPYAVLIRSSGRNLFCTNAGDALDEITLAIHVWHDDHDAGRAILEQIQATFDRSAFDLSDGPRVVQMRRAAEAAAQHEGGAWQFTIEFLVQVYLPSGE
jgi:hypothetical protein